MKLFMVSGNGLEKLMKTTLSEPLNRAIFGAYRTDDIIKGCDENNTVLFAQQQWDETHPDKVVFHSKIDAPVGILSYLSEEQRNDIDYNDIDALYKFINDSGAIAFGPTLATINQAILDAGISAIFAYNPDGKGKEAGHPYLTLVADEPNLTKLIDEIESNKQFYQTNFVKILRETPGIYMLPQFKDYSMQDPTRLNAFALVELIGDEKEAGELFENNVMETYNEPAVVEGLAYVARFEIPTMPLWQTLSILTSEANRENKYKNIAQRTIEIMTDKYPILNAAFEVLEIAERFNPPRRKPDGPQNG